MGKRLSRKPRRRWTRRMQSKRGRGDTRGCGTSLLSPGSSRPALLSRVVGGSTSTGRMWRLSVLRWQGHAHAHRPPRRRAARRARAWHPLSQAASPDAEGAGVDRGRGARVRCMDGERLRRSLRVPVAACVVWPGPMALGACERGGALQRVLKLWTLVQLVRLRHALRLGGAKQSVNGTMRARL